LLRAAALPGAVTALGRVRGVRELDLHGRAAELEVERVLAGAAPAGERRRFGWEELAAGRPTRFAEDDRVLLVLEPAADSIWRARAGGAELDVVAAGGEAFDRDPGAAAVEALAAYLALAPEARAGSAAADALAALAAAASPNLAAGALDAVDALPAAALEGKAAERLGALLLDAGRPQALRLQAIGLAGRRRVPPLRPALEALWRRDAEPAELRGAALAALAALPGGAPAGSLPAALEDADPELRAAAVRADGALGEGRLASLAARDPAPAVRAAAVARLAALPAARASGPVLAALEDPDGRVREAAIRGAAGFGAAAVPALVERVERSDIVGARAPLAALALAGPAGEGELRRIAEEHGDERVRALARVFLGQPPFPAH
jgi:hypothetical protein